MALFLTRIGASIVEATTESYFFKHASLKHMSEISLFRVLYPLSYITIPILASGILFLFDSFFILFASLASMIFLSIFAAGKITDTK